MLSRMKSLRLRAALMLCALSGALLALCFPAPGWWPLAWVALAPWLIVLRWANGWGVALGSWLGGAVFFGSVMYWLGLFGLSVWALASIALGLPLLLWGLAVRWTGRLGPLARVISAAVLWCGVEYARGLGPFGSTWGGLGYSQSPALFLLPVARYTGTLGLSFLIVLMNGALAEVMLSWSDRARGRVIGRAAAVLLAIVVVVIGARMLALRMGGPKGAPVTVALIQGSISGPLQPEDTNLPLSAEEQTTTRRAYLERSAELARAKPMLVVWPESVLYDDPDNDPVVAEWVARAARVSRAWLLAGGPYQDETGRQFNSAYLYAPRGNQVARYDKVHLVPFGEFVPWREHLLFLERYHVRRFDFASGSAHRVLQAGVVGLGPMICFESIFPQISSDLVGRGAQLLVVMTNDAWFGHTAAAAQHRQIAVLRAVETNRWVIRAASTGISSIIAPDGRIIAEAGLFEAKTLTAEVRLARAGRQSRPPGRLFAGTIVVLSLAFLLAPAAMPHRRNTRQDGKG